MGLTIDHVALMRGMNLVRTHWELNPTVVRLTPPHYMELLRYSRHSMLPPSAPTPEPPPVLGLAVIVDQWLPDGVWRLTGEDGRLLYDVRQGKKGSEW